MGGEAETIETNENDRTESRDRALWIGGLTLRPRLAQRAGGALPDSLGKGKRFQHVKTCSKPPVHFSALIQHQHTHRQQIKKENEQNIM